MVKKLKNKPLVEAIFEMRWVLQGNPPAPLVDPHYKLLLGRLYDRLHEGYPTHEQLPSANIPDDLVGHVVQHRFRVSDNSWPLVQVGPGVFTVNSTNDYTWSDFRPRVLDAIKKLYESHPKAQELRVSNLILRYIDAVDFDYRADNIFDFLRDKLKLEVSLPEDLFSETSIQNRPASFTWHCSFKSEQPNGLINIRFATGQKKNAPILVWETTVESTDNNLPQMPSGFEKWFDDAHTITDDWFFKLIEGELERRFSGE